MKILGQKFMLFVIAVGLADSALAFEVRGIEPGKTTAKEAQKIVEKHKKAPADHPGPWGKGDCSVYEDLPIGSPLKGYKYCRWMARHLNNPTFGPLVIAGVYGHPGWEIDSKGVLQAFDFVFDSRRFEQLKTAAIEKWGSPANHQRQGVQNRMGATFENEVLVWKDGTGTVYLYRFWPRGDDYKLDLGFLEIKSSQFMADTDKDAALRRTQKRKDF